MPAVTAVPLLGLPEVRAGEDLAALVVSGAQAADAALREGDIVVVSSKVVSKALNLWAEGDAREAAVEAHTSRVVAERRSGGRLTRIVEAAAGPVMAAAGVDASNTGDRDGVLLLPTDPDGEADRLRVRLLALTGLSRVGVVLSDTAGRPWRAGQVDFALGASGVGVLDDLRGGVDADGRPLSVTVRALADELAAAADLVKGKADAIPVALLRGTPWALPQRGAGAAALVRVGAQDWFELGTAESVRAALGVAPGSPEALEAGIPSTAPEDRRDRLARAVAVALSACPGAAVDIGGMDDLGDKGGDVGADLVRVCAQTPYELGVAVSRLQVALWGEGLDAEVPSAAGGPEVAIRVKERQGPVSGSLGSADAFEAASGDPDAAASRRRG
ncbi:coenzyme F420-0:L-glutamate ligase [Pedococcus sp. 5OH_020]|uniref:coenzyme F420-0:L-glutamate ligase n=1 Tax=Pedococcus sp. 5OH_020 TaxID=2989814 RepID=UPI0022E9F5B6|nr:coenzyme F420-0:L-glutamate ligase [Pedococcus sp. 5OH_020]